MKTDAVLTAEKIASDAASLNGRAYYVGGCVRDSLMGIESKDIDIEIHGLTEDELERILQPYGDCRSVGKSFGIHTIERLSLDIAMPRRERNTGDGHRDLDVQTDPFLGTLEAARRRDFTVNALMKDVLTGEVIDHFGGEEDLKNGILRHVDDRTFPEDPLRVLRGAQFAARFGFTIAPETRDLMKKVPLGALSGERVEGELKKALLRSRRPSVFFEALADTEAADIWFPEITALRDVPQDPLWHPEGNVYIHTMQVLDEAAALRSRAEEPYSFMLSALCHDLGKASATETVDGHIHAYDHEKAGIVPAAAFLERIRSSKEILRYVESMILLHMKPTAMYRARSRIKNTNRLFDDAICGNDLILLAEADWKGSCCTEDFSPAESFLRERLSVYEEIMARPCVTGADLIRCGVEPGREFSDFLSYAHKLRLAGIEKESQLKQTLAYINTKKRKQ